jgi:protoporphyrinogen oxidase
VSRIATIVVGGGIAGLTSALRLSERGDDVTVVDAESTVGGLTRPWEIGGVTWDRFYHVVLPSDTNTHALLDRIGLAEQLVFKSVKTNLFMDGRLHPFSGMRDFLAFPGLAATDKIRLVANIAHARYGGNDDAYDCEGVIEYLTRWSGARTVEKIWRPLLRAKLGDDHESASAAFIRATIKRLQGARRSGVRSEEYGFVRGGYAAVLAALQRSLERLGVRFVLGHRARNVVVHDDRAIVALGGTEISGDRAILTLPSTISASLCPQLNAAERQLLTRDAYFGVVCVSLLVNRRLGEAYVTNVAENDFPFTGIINMSALVGREAFDGYDLVYLPKYVPAESRGLADSDDALVARSIASLQRVFPMLAPEDIVAARVARAGYVFPFPRVGRAASLPPARTSVRRIAIVNNARLRHATLNVSDTIGVVDEALAELDSDPTWSNVREATGRAVAGSR